MKALTERGSFPSVICRRRRVRAGFTLIELLIAIGIISALIAILMPSLSAARARGQRTACATNLRQIGVAMRSYLDSSNDIYPHASFMPSFGPSPLDGDTPLYLPDVLAPHGADNPKVFHCPNDIGAIQRPEPNVGKSYFESERSSYEYRFRLGGRSIKEALERFAQFTGTHIQESTFWIMRDYDNFHGTPDKPGARRYLYNDGRVTDYEN